MYRLKKNGFGTSSNLRTETARYQQNIRRATEMSEGLVLLLSARQRVCQPRGHTRQGTNSLSVYQIYQIYQLIRVCFQSFQSLHDKHQQCQSLPITFSITCCSSDMLAQSPCRCERWVTKHACKHSETIHKYSQSAKDSQDSASVLRCNSSYSSYSKV